MAGLPSWPSKGGTKLFSNDNIELARGDDDGGRSKMKSRIDLKDFQKLDGKWR